MDYAGITAGDPPSITHDDPNTLYDSFWQGERLEPAAWETMARNHRAYELGHCAAIRPAR